MGKITFEPIWFDSLGAKSSCALVKTPDVSILIDPGAAVMQPSFPAPWAKKLYWLARAELTIKRAAKRADVVVISHYHYDHFTDFDRGLYEGKLLLAKNPNSWINDSQRDRAEHFLDNLCRTFGKIKLEEVLREHEPKTYGNPLDEIPHARDKDFGDYNRRREELFKKGLKWFQGRAEHWNSNKLIPELKFENVEVRFPEDKEFKFGRTRLRFTPALFHGIEFSRVGWVFATVVEYGREKFIHSSDLSGVYIEDYAEWLLQEDPNKLILDGPPTYMRYMLIRTNLNRCIENTCKVINQSKNLELMIYDHHLLREKNYRMRTKKVWETAGERGVRIMTAAEYLGKKAVLD